MDVAVKRIAVCLAGLLLAGTSMTAQVHEVHVGGGPSVYDILGVPYQDGIEAIGPAVNAGYKSLWPLKGNLQWYVGADMFGRTLRFEGPWYFGINQKKSNSGFMVNIPVGTGLRCNLPLSEKFSAYADLGLGLNLDLGYRVEKDGHGMEFNPYNGQPLGKSYEEMVYFKYLTSVNAFSGILSFIHEFPWTISTYFTVEFGAVYGKHWSLGLSYANFGLVEITRGQGLTAANYVPGTNIESEMTTGVSSGRGTMVLSSLSLRFGYLF